MSPRRPTARCSFQTGTIPVLVGIRWAIPTVAACQDNPIADADHSLLRLPANQSEGHLPKIALATGHSDALDCLLRKIGIADSEFTPDSGNGRVSMFVGGDAGSGTGARKPVSTAAAGGATGCGPADSSG